MTTIANDAPRLDITASVGAAFSLFVFDAADDLTGVTAQMVATSGDGTQLFSVSTGSGITATTRTIDGASVTGFQISVPASTFTTVGKFGHALKVTPATGANDATYWFAGYLDVEAIP